MTREILLLGNPILRMKCRRVTDFTHDGVDGIIADLRDTLESFRSAHGFGRGIAAPQIGVSKRIIFINTPSPMALINPEIIRRSRRRMTLWDDCFSFPDLLVRVKRHLGIVVHYSDEHGKRHVIEATAALSELLQHEIDHLDGILAVDRAIDSRHIVLRSEWKKLTESTAAGYRL